MGMDAALAVDCISRSDCHHDEKQQKGEAHSSGSIEQWIKQLLSRWSSARCLHSGTGLRSDSISISSI